MDAFPDPGPYVARIGLIDLPREQRMAPLDLDLRGDSAHIVVLGGPDSGRSSALRAIGHALADRHTPDDLLVLGIDLDGDSLRPLEALPHTASIAGRRDDELTGRILREALRVIDRRADGSAATSLADARPAAPEIVLLIDGYSTLRMREDLHDQVAAIATRGADLGVHLVLTASRWHDLRPAVQTAVHRRIELPLTDPLDAVLDRRLSGHLETSTPGRAVVGVGRIAQLVVPGDGIDERAAYLTIAARHRGRARPIGLLPRDLRLAEVLAQVPDASGAVWLGVEEDDLRPVALDPDEPHLLVFGDRRSGRTQLLRSCATQWRSIPGTTLAVVDPRRTLLDALPQDSVAASATTPTGTADLVRSLVSELTSRAALLDAASPRFVADETAGSPAAPSRIVLVVDDAELVTGALDPLAPLEPFLARGTDLGFSLVLARHSGGAARALYSPVLQRVKELGCPGLLLSGDPEEGPLWPGATMRPLPAGRALLTRRGQSPCLVHLARL